MGHDHQFLHDMVKRDYTTIDGQVMSIEYVTASPTFTGIIGGYTTASQTASQSQTSQSRSQSSPSSASSTATRSISSQSIVQTSAVLTSASAAAATSSNFIAFSSSPAAASNPSNYATNSVSSAATAGANSGNSSTSSTSDSEMSIAAKAGLAVGVILAIIAVLGLILFCLSRKKKNVKVEQARQDAEKNAAIATQRAAAGGQRAIAPRLSLRPASSFLPEFLGGNRPKSRLSQGNMLSSSNESNPMKERYLAAPGVGQAIPMSEKPAPAENPFKDPENPFADPVKPAAPIKQQTPISNPVLIPMPEPERVAGPLPMPEPASAPAPLAMPTVAPIRNSPSVDNIAAAAASAGAVTAARTAVQKHESPRSSPRLQANQGPVEMPSPVPVPAPLHTPRSAPASAPPLDGNVYRILLDFIPSMEDELELRAGQVVRLLHEYDDGWCLAISLDRSQQGVVPRTCLAAKPSKPRPQPGNRPMSPAMRNGPTPPRGRNSPAMGRPMSPANSPQMSPSSYGRNSPAMNRPMSPGAYNQAPRPLSPGPRSSRQRSMSPGPYGHAGGPPPMGGNQRRRSKSSSTSAREVRDRRASPPGPSKLGPGVPGMAM